MFKSNLYRLSTTIFAKAFPRLIETIIHKGHKIKILCYNEEEMKSWDNMLWLFPQLSFIPHGTESDPHPDRQPALLTVERTLNVNQADVLFCNFEIDISQNPEIKILVSMFPEAEDLDVVNRHAQFMNRISNSFSVFKEYSGGWQQ